jgi:hypothetical protein
MAGTKKAANAAFERRAEYRAHGATYYRGVTFSACGPFLPWLATNDTR